MTSNYFIIPCLSFLVIFPAMLLCYAPTRNFLRFSRIATVSALALVCALLSVIITMTTVELSQDFGIFNVLGLMLLFFLFHRSTTLHISQSAAIFLLVCAFYTFLANFSIVYDAFRHPTGKLIHYSFGAFFLLIGICTAFFAIAVFPMAKYGAYVIDHMQQHNVWWLTAFISAVFYLFNLRMVVHYYTTLHYNKVGVAYITVMVVMFVLLILLCIVLYHIVRVLVQKAETDDKNRILEMQEKQFESLQNYLDADAKVRHDFRQTIYTLTELSARKDYKAIDEYLSRYGSEVPQKDTNDFCSDHALNALLNHYYRRAEKNDIRCEFKVIFPEELHIDIIALCTIIGNILENAIIACLDIPEEKRYIRMVISEEQNHELYIAVSNSFSGKVRKRRDLYVSTHKEGNGIGLVSVAAAAARYGGTAEFTNGEEIFYSNVMLVNS